MCTIQWLAPRDHETPKASALTMSRITAAQEMGCEHRRIRAPVPASHFNPEPYLHQWSLGERTAAGDQLMDATAQRAVPQLGFRRYQRVTRARTGSLHPTRAIRLPDRSPAGETVQGMAADPCRRLLSLCACSTHGSAATSSSAAPRARTPENPSGACRWLPVASGCRYPVSPGRPCRGT